MPGMPEVQWLVDFLRGRVVGHAITRATVSAISALKTYDPPITDLQAATVSSVERHGKFLDLGTDAGPHLVFHLAKAGWLRWYDTRSEEHTSELQSLMRISYAVFCLKKKNNKYS